MDRHVVLARRPLQNSLNISVAAAEILPVRPASSTQSSKTDLSLETTDFDWSMVRYVSSCGQLGPNMSPNIGQR